MVDAKLTSEKLEEYRQEMEAAIIIVENLSKYCSTPDELVAMMRLAADNEGQLRLVMSSIMNTSKGK